MDSGSKPILFTCENIPWCLTPSSSFATTLDQRTCSKISPCYGAEAGDLVNKLDPELTAVWVAISNFCSQANAAMDNGGPKITEEAFLHSMGSTVYKLLHQRFDLGSLDEAIRLGLLAFSSPIYLHWNRVELPDPRFNLAFRKALSALILQASGSVTPREWIWLYMIAALSMFHEPDSILWLKSLLCINLSLCDVRTWTHLRRLLDSFVWVGMLYDRQGRDIYELTTF